MLPSVLKRRSSEQDEQHLAQKQQRIQKSRLHYLKTIMFAKPIVTDVRYIPRYQEEDLPEMFYSRQELKEFRDLYIEKRKRASQLQLDTKQFELFIDEEPSRYICIEGVC